MAHAVLGQPIRQLEQVSGHRPEGPDLLDYVTLGLDAADASHNGFVVDIQPGHVTVHDVHGSLLRSEPLLEDIGVVTAAFSYPQAGLPILVALEPNGDIVVAGTSLNTNTFTFDLGLAEYLSR
jgi:hypothetical protein